MGFTYLIGRKNSDDGVVIGMLAFPGYDPGTQRNGRTGGRLIGQAFGFGIEIQMAVSTKRYRDPVIVQVSYRLNCCLLRFDLFQINAEAGKLIEVLAQLDPLA